MHSLDELSSYGLYNLSLNGMDILSIIVFPREVHGLHKFSVTGLKILSVKVFPRDFRESVGIMLNSGLPGLNGLGT